MTKFNQAVLAAASSIALFGGAMTLITPSAEAKVTNCWMLPRTGESAQPFNCDINKRTLTDNTIVYDIRHFEGKGAYFTVRLWENKGVPTGADVWIEGEQYKADYYTDKDGDTRLDLGKVGQFIF